MNGKIFFSLLTAFIISSCGNNGVPGTTTHVPSPTATPSSAFVAEAPPTPAGTSTPAGPKAGDIYAVTENGHTYEYVYNEELGTGVREVANFPLLDYPYENFMPFKILIADDVQGEESLFAMLHKDDTPGSGLNSSGTYDPTPIKAHLSVAIRERYFSEDKRSLSSNVQQEAIYDEMLGKGEPNHEQAYLPVFLSDGKTEAKVKLSPDTGIIMTIMTPEKIKELGGDRVSQWTYGSISKGIFFTFYSEVYGVDDKGNMSVRFALDGSWSDSKLTEEMIRVALLSIPANLAEHKDQSKQGVTDFGITLGHVSAWTQADGVTPDLFIERVMPSDTEAQTPSPTPTP